MDVLRHYSKNIPMFFSSSAAIPYPMFWVLGDFRKDKSMWFNLTEAHPVQLFFLFKCVCFKHIYVHIADLRTYIL